MKNVIILGHTGLLGRYILNYLRQDGRINTICLSDFNVVCLTSKDILQKLSCHDNIDYVINCIGLIRQRTDVSEEDFTAVNAVFPHNLYKACSFLNSKMIHISTDCVFDGERGYYNELDNTNANDLYGKSKINGEPEEASVIRVSFIGEEINRKLSLLEKVRECSGGEWPGYTNQMWNGITALTMAKIIHYIIDNGMHWNGVRHVFSSNHCSKYELVSLINDTYGFGINMKEALAGKHVNRILNTVYPDFINSFYIPDIREQLVELKRFDINNSGAHNGPHRISKK